MPSSSEWRDRIEIAHIAQGWAMWRDDGDWDSLRAAFAPDGFMTTTHAQVPASQFVDLCIAANGKMPFRGQHFVSPSVVRVGNDRAIADTRQMLLMRAILDGVEVDITCLGRAHDRFVRLAQGWCIQQRFAIYERDRIDPVIPGTAIAIDEARLARFPAAYRFTGYVQETLGLKVNLELPTSGSEAHRQLVSESNAWLDAAP